MFSDAHFRWGLKAIIKLLIFLYLLNTTVKKIQRIDITVHEQCECLMTEKGGRP